jgi:FMN phosphatase YigB (HAD superfamily)
MIRGIIFDFNRTLYIPELQEIPEETVRLLIELKEAGIALALISMRESRREDMIDLYHLSSLFSIMRFVDEKDGAVFQEVLQSLGCAPDEAIVVGDRVRSEIRTANLLGIRTIWLRQGEFSQELPAEPSENPTWTIDRLPRVRDIIDEQQGGVMR